MDNKFYEPINLNDSETGYVYPPPDKTELVYYIQGHNEDIYQIMSNPYYWINKNFVQALHDLILIECIKNPESVGEPIDILTITKKASIKRL